MQLESNYRFLVLFVFAQNNRDYSLVEHNSVFLYRIS